MKDQRDNQRAYQRKRYLANVAAGICTYCCKRPAAPGKRICPECSQRLAERRRNKHIIEAPKKWPAGWCYVCGEPTDPGRKLCIRHRKVNWRGMNNATSTDTEAVQTT